MFVKSVGVSEDSVSEKRSSKFGRGGDGVVTTYKSVKANVLWIRQK